MFAKLISILTLSALVFVFGYFNMTLGWGLEVKSWFWLIFPVFMNAVLMNCITTLMKEGKG